MWKIATYSLLLIAGIAASQFFDLDGYTVQLIDIPIPLTNFVIPLSFFKIQLSTITMICLAYIMIEVGFEFVIDKSKLSSYWHDYLIAMTSATFPWIFCSLYFYFVIQTDMKEALLIGRFAAPTSAGVLFAMLSAAGLATTWFFKKARILAIFDDLDTILLMIPIQILFVGLKIEALYLIIVIFLMLFFAYRFLHKLKLSTQEGWLLVYSFIIVMLCIFVEYETHIELEVLLPAFAFGCMLYNPYIHDHSNKYAHLHAFLEPEDKASRFIDGTVKHVFMFLVGASLPKINFAEFNLILLVGHVLILTILSNIGKMYPTFCYKKEASFRERLALSVSMFPRGEVGAGVLLIAINYQVNDKAIKIAALSLTLNLLLTGFFILIALWLVKAVYKVENK